MILRRLSQIFFGGFFIYVLWSTTYPLTGSVDPESLFKINPLLMAMTSISERVLLPGLLSAGALILATFILGRFFCGWVCPLGGAMDLARFVSRRKISKNNPRNAARIKYVILAGIFILAVFGIQAAWPFDPIVIAARFVSLNLIPSITFLIEKLFVFLVRDLNLHGAVYDFYRALKDTVLGVKVFYFPNSGFVFLAFAAIAGASVLMTRAWCRFLCPLGALLALVSKFSLLERYVKKCVNCGKCVSACRMGAIKDGNEYVKEECVLCMDCVYDCPVHSTEFSFKRPSKYPAPGASEKGGITRRQFLYLLGGSAVLAAAGRIIRTGSSLVIRPPAAQREDKFVNTCVRCGNCMKVCITNGLQPSLTEAGAAGIWTPKLVPEIGYCEYNCTLCGNVCPTGAIPALSLEKKHQVRLGLAKVIKERCIAWANNEQCIVCEEHCPVPEKAIKVIEEFHDGKKVLKPYVDPNLCVGCGICQNKCPVRPLRAIVVDPSGADRT